MKNSIHVSVHWHHHESYLTPNTLLLVQMLPIVVGVRQYSARLEMFRQLAKQLDPAEVR